MPLYRVHHSYPLTDAQRQSIAGAITDLHCAAFTTPSFFVHVQFTAADVSDGTYFMAGKPRTVNSNRIVALVRTSAARQKSDFDALAAKIEDAWYDALGTGGDASKQDEEAKRLLLVIFVPLLAAREAGVTIPVAGHEGEWFKEQMPYFKQMSEKGGEDFSGLLEELQQRDDLKKLLE